MGPVAGGGVHANGARDRAWNYTLDGIDVNETSAGGGNFSPLRTNPDMLSEFRVVTSNATVDKSGNPLPNINVVLYDVAANDPDGLGLDPTVQKVLNSMPLPNNYTVGDGLNVAGFSF